MCGRFWIRGTDPEIMEMVLKMNRSPLANRFRKLPGEPLSADGEILPSAVVPVIASSRSGNRSVFPMRWGFSRGSLPGSGSSLLINARVETAAEKPTFRDSWEKHRCVIPASWYFEWDHPAGPDGKKKPGQKYALKPEDGPFWLAGLYRMEQDIPVFVVLTRAASEEIRWMHDRMPVMLPGDEARDWIRPDADPAALTARCLTRVGWEKAV
ncbi:MAG: SOS response-associated peptidase [Clostridiales bacterium]|nr:SOS response-associated peptidase [Clostridiales bacterium]